MTSPIEAGARADITEELLMTLRFARIFITSREKMHPTGIMLYDDLTAAIASGALVPASQLAAERGQVKRLQRDCAEAYQVVGVLSDAHGSLFDHPQVIKALDNLSAASGPSDPRPHDDLLPFAPITIGDPIASAVAAERERCAKVAEQQAIEFLSPEYAINQPFSSINERFACEEVAAAIRALEPASGDCGWQDISTAPKDGTHILAYTPDGIHGPVWAVVHWYVHEGESFKDAGEGLYRKEKYEIEWWEGAGFTPFHATHWTPLPASPNGRAA